MKAPWFFEQLLADEARKQDTTGAVFEYVSRTKEIVSVTVTDLPTDSLPVINPFHRPFWAIKSGDGVDPEWDRENWLRDRME